ncbi:MAG: ribosome small subunit-dependent GTPase A [Anaerolineaceae bacterium]|nr:ribosome small subunit-dependent GTPase A [Anaerolineaceae bacterium]
MNKKNNELHDGVVIKKNKGQYWVWTQGHSLRCGLKLPATPARSKTKKGGAKIRKDAADIVVGDHVTVSKHTDGSALICEVHPRANRLARRAAKPKPGAQAVEQVVAANIDQMVAVMSLSQPAPSWNLLDRYLVSAESLEIEALICLTKTDVAGDEHGDLDEKILLEIETFRQVGEKVMLTSARTGEGLPELKQMLDGKVSVLIGKSGAGKSSLLNLLLPDLDLRVGEVNSATGKGRHTTTGAEMVACESGGWLIDTAGTREFGLWDVDSDDMAWFFPEMRPWLGQCRFGLDCQHDEEPGCAVRQAVMSGKISPRRYFSMMKLKEEGYFQ